MTKRTMINNIQGRASTLVYLFNEGLIESSDLPLYCLKSKVDRNTLLKTADFLAKNHMIDSNPFAYELYRDSPIRLNRSRVRPNIGEKWCSPCGKYLGHMHFYIYSASDNGFGSTTYSEWCKMHARKWQAEYDSTHKVERRKSRKSRAKQKINA